MTSRPPRCFIAGFDFEHHLAGKPSTAHTERLSAELAACWLAVASDGDFILTPQLPDAPFPQSLPARWPRVTFVADLYSLPADCDLVPWGWSEQWCRAADQRGQPHPPAEVVRHVNSRACSHPLEQEFQTALPGAAVIRSEADLQTTLASCGPGQKWVIKAEWSMSARERILGQGSQITPAATGWVKKRLAATPVYFEPWVERVTEAGFQYEIYPDGRAELLTAVPLLTDFQGNYRGSLLQPAPEQEDVRPLMQTIGERIAATGYVGPLGLDAMWYRTVEGDLRFRAIQDINARWTMGRLAVLLRDRLSPGEVGAFTHFRWPSTDPENNRQWLAQQAGLDCFSPLTIQGEPTHLGYGLLRGDSESELLGEWAA